MITLTISNCEQVHVQAMPVLCLQVPTHAVPLGTPVTSYLASFLCLVNTYSSFKAHSLQKPFCDITFTHWLFRTCSPNTGLKLLSHLSVLLTRLYAQKQWLHFILLVSSTLSKSHGREQSAPRIPVYLYLWAQLIDLLLLLLYNLKGKVIMEGWWWDERARDCTRICGLAISPTSYHPLILTRVMIS